MSELDADSRMGRRRVCLETLSAGIATRASEREDAAAVGQGRKQMRPNRSPVRSPCLGMREEERSGDITNSIDEMCVRSGSDVSCCYIL